MARATLKIILATGLYAAVHSALASRAAKRAATRWLGERRRNALYRPFYLVQSLVTFGGLVVYIARLPGTTLYHVRGGPALVLRLGQGLAMAYAVSAAHEVGITRMLGLNGLVGWALRRDVPPEPEAQGPAYEDGAMRATGPFAWSRHPLNLAPLPIFLLEPRMTTRRAAFTAAAALYLLLGSVHEEARLLQAYGPAYARYRDRGPRFYLPGPKAGP